MSDWNHQIIEEFRGNEGRVGGVFEGKPLILLHTVGARTGKGHLNPLMYLDLDGHRYVFASKGGADTTPDWYRNLVAKDVYKRQLRSASLTKGVLYTRRRRLGTRFEEGEVGAALASVRTGHRTGVGHRGL